MLSYVIDGYTIELKKMHILTLTINVDDHYYYYECDKNVDALYNSIDNACKNNNITGGVVADCLLFGYHAGNNIQILKLKMIEKTLIALYNNLNDYGYYVYANK